MSPCALATTTTNCEELFFCVGLLALCGVFDPPIDIMNRPWQQQEKNNGKDIEKPWTDPKPEPEIILNPNNVVATPVTYEDAINAHMQDPIFFQLYQFEKKLDNVTRRLEDTGIFKKFERDEVFNSGRGFQIRTFREKKREVPEWAKSKQGVQQILLTAFPKLHSNQLQRQRAARWAQVIEGYYWKRWTDSEIAEEMGESKAAIKSVLRSITRTAEGRTANGRCARKHADSCQAQAA